MPRKKNIQFQVENIEKVPIDIDGDGEPDGYLVTMFVNGKAVSKKFVPLQRLKGIVDKASLNATQNSVVKTVKSRATTPREPKSRVVYNKLPAQPDQTPQPLQVQDKTTFGQYVKQGVGIYAGKAVVEGVVDGLKSLFSSDDGGGDDE